MQLLGVYGPSEGQRSEQGDGGQTGSRGRNRATKRWSVLHLLFPLRGLDCGLAAIVLTVAEPFRHDIEQNGNH